LEYLNKAVEGDAKSLCSDGRVLLLMAAVLVEESSRKEKDGWRDKHKQPQNANKSFRNESMVLLVGLLCFLWW